jgi:hypothetical protein
LKTEVLAKDEDDDRVCRHHSAFTLATGFATLARINLKFPLINQTPDSSTIESDRAVICLKCASSDESNTAFYMVFTNAFQDRPFQNPADEHQTSMFGLSDG